MAHCLRGSRPSLPFPNECNDIPTKGTRGPCVIVSTTCDTSTPQAGGLKQQTFIPRRSGDWISKIRVAAWTGSR